MPSLETARNINKIKCGGTRTLGQIYKEDSDFLMDELWSNDSSSKVCYIYDYFHDDEPDLSFGMTYENTTKTKIDAKFLVTKYPTIDKGKVEYHLMFRPSQKTIFNENDELYYFETDYRKRYFNEHFVGMYVDVPDDEGNYRKWLIVEREEGLSFIKYKILKCDLNLMWIETNGSERNKRKMWGVILGQSSYNAGIYSYYTTTKMENQDRCWLPLNSITEKIWYTNDINNNLRVLVGALCEHPIAWIVSKVENVDPRGIQQITFYQSEFNPHTDYINFETGEMYANYYVSENQNYTPSTPTTNQYGKLLATTSTIKIGGSYKTISVCITDEEGTDVTNTYADSDLKWSFTINGLDVSNIITLVDTNIFSKKKVKFLGNREYLQKTLKIECTINDEIKINTSFEIIV